MYRVFFLVIIVAFTFFGCGEDSTGNQDNYCDITETKTNGEVFSVDPDDWKPASLIVNNDSMFIESHILPNPIIDHTELKYTRSNLDSMFVYYDLETFWYENNEYKTGSGVTHFVSEFLPNGLNTLNINLEYIVSGCYRMHIVGVRNIGNHRYTLETYGDFKVE